MTILCKSLPALMNGAKKGYSFGWKKSFVSYFIANLRFGLT